MNPMNALNTADQSNVMVRLEKVSKTYWMSRENVIHAVVDTSLDVARGEFLVITGRSGSGKTTLLNLVAGLTPPSSGKIYLDGQDLWSLADKQQSVIRNHKIGFIFQFPSLLPSLTAMENVLLPTIFSKNTIDGSGDQRAIELMETVGLKDKLNAFPRQLSAGQQQRVVVARALLNQPELLLADEPTSDLDEQTETEIMDMFKQVHHTTGITIILVTHSTQLVSYGTRSIHMAGGMIEPVTES
jgi:putative ABC transport system ATP-binding protein/lipoprotein-releasing system ATP-binding protein